MVKAVMAKKSQKIASKKTNPKKSVKKLTIKKPSDVPITLGVFESFRSEIIGLFMQSEKRMEQMDAKFTSKFQEVDSRFNQMDSKFEQMELKNDANHAKLSADIARNITLNEEQKAQNKIVMEQNAGIIESVEAFKEEVRSDIKDIYQIISAKKID